MQVCTSLQTDNHASTPPLKSFFTGRMPFLPPNQQRQGTEGITITLFQCYRLTHPLSKISGYATAIRLTHHRPVFFACAYDALVWRLPP